MPSVRLAAAELQEFATQLFCAADVPAEEAQIVAASLVESNLRGHDSHGVVRVPDYLKQLKKGHLKAGVDLRVLSETPAMIAADAELGFGFVHMRHLIDRLLPKVNELGVACGTLVNSGHVGRLGEWVERTAEKGIAGLIAVNDNGVLKCVAPPGGTTPSISTNPVALGMPTGSGPLVLDVSTSAVANGKIKVAYLAGRPCPEGWLQDHEGNATTDPSVRFTDPRGSILPMGGYKGFGLGLLFDILVGGLTGGFCPPAPEGAPGTNNVVMVLWNPEKYAGREHFLAEADKLLDFVRNSERKQGVETIRLPGDRSAATREQRLADGIELDAGTWDALCESARRFDVPLPV